jgi:hypothetical protein
MKRNNIVFIFLIAILATSCSLIFEPDLSNKKVTLLAPADCTRTPTQTQTFWWDYVPDAEGYNLQIVSPTFDTITTLIADTNMTGNKFVGTLYPGRYKWGVSAYNHNSSTDYSVFTLIIDTTSSLTSQKVRLISPPNGTNTNILKILFHWETIPIATSYQIDIRDSTWTGQSVINPTYTNYDTITFTLQEGSYIWGVRALNDNSFTIEWMNFQLILDATPPGIPNLISPGYDGDTLNNSPYEVEWTHPAYSLSAISDSLIISSDSLFTVPGIKESVFLNTTSHSVSFLPDGKYYIKVKSIDAAGNKSDYCHVRKFFLSKQE